MKELWFLLLIATSTLQSGYSQIAYDSCIIRLSKEQLLTELGRYTEYWQNDSLATNGFRRFFGWEFIRCSITQLEGTSWDTIAVYLGRPHFIIKDKKKSEETIFRYVLHTYGDYHDYKEIGNLIMQIIVVNGVIKWIGIAENEG